MSVTRGGYTRWATLTALATCLAALTLSCRQTPDPAQDDVPTKGRVTILADEELRDLVEAEEFMFESTYGKAQLDIRYLPEAELLKAVMNDSVRCWIATVRPGGEQEAYYARRNITPHVIPIAMDGIAIAVHKQRPGARADLATLKGFLSGRLLADTVNGRVERWTTHPVMAGRGCGVARSLVDSLWDQAPDRINAMVEADVTAAIGRVAKDPACVAFLPFAAICDLDNPRMRALREQVRLLPIARDEETPAVAPSQSTLADGSYPLRRPVYMVLVEGKSGLGTGFVSFVANHKGQRIILKHGLAPQKVPAREIEIAAP